jgi:hypothetical protein
MNDMPYPPDPIPFDDYYQWLKEFVSSPIARREIARFNEAERRFFEETGSPDAYSDDPEAFEARGAYEHVGVEILQHHGWPSYQEMVQSFKDSIGTLGRNLLSEMRMFCGMGKMIIEGGWESQIPGFNADINDRSNIKEFIRLCLEVEWMPADLKVDLENGNV